ncbi:hypothetical protein HQ38_09045 [Porphyromonas crevioricanis]|uniref:Uncharacterized protein n=1 Tax=Porphyromonas crevioricanis TaxID=393921 RepID=A0AB34PF32_9PORP|nr:hypothetical protein HQ38_09045 [Porphyromonas crevioricanis]
MRRLLEAFWLKTLSETFAGQLPCKGLYKPNGSITIEVADDREDNRSEQEKEAEEDYQKQLVRQRKGTDE